MLHVWSNASNKIDIFVDKIANTVRMFRHGEMLLLPHARMIIRHRNRTRRGNSSFPFHFVSRIRLCIFSIRAHISSWSRTRDTTSIRGLNHGWNRTIAKRMTHNLFVILQFSFGSLVSLDWDATFSIVVRPRLCCLQQQEENWIHWHLWIAKPQIQFFLKLLFAQCNFPRNNVGHVQLRDDFTFGWCHFLF